jgi:flavin-dependent dehydrogenase
MTNPYGYGVLIDRSRFEAWLISEGRRAGVTILSVDRRLHAETIGSTWRVASDSEVAPRCVVTPLILQATGRASGVFGPREREQTDRLVALLMYGATPPGPRDQRLLIEASQQGWWYAAPLPHSRAVVAFMTDVDLLPPTSKGRTAYFHSRHVIHGNAWVSIGDAAATYDPLSGRGVPVALAKGAAVARLVSNCSSYSRALQAYADAERATFADYRADQRRTYRRAAFQFQTS